MPRRQEPPAASNAHSSGTEPHRGRPLRVERPGTLFFVTSRTLGERLLLHPLVEASGLPKNRALRLKLEAYERANDRWLRKMLSQSHKQRGPFQPKLTLETAKRLLRGLIGAALARAQDKYGIEVFAAVAMSNHFHIVVRAPDKNLSTAMGYFKARITEGINLLYGRRGTLWYRRFDAEPILDAASCQERVLYTAVNPVRAGLVPSAEQWPGLLLMGGLGGSGSDTDKDADTASFEFLNRSAWHEAGRPEDLRPFFETVTLTLSPLPEWASMPQGSQDRGSSYRDALRAALEEREAQARALADDEGKKQGSLETLSRVDPQGRPEAPDRTRRPYVHVRCPDKEKAFKQEVDALYEAYPPCSLRFRQQEDLVTFPEGTYPPPLLAAA